MRYTSIMTIQDYSFGSMRINSTEYGDDVVILPPRILCPWWRGQGHLLAMSDLGEVLAYGPRVLVVGTGASGLMAVPRETIDALGSAGIRTEPLVTSAAVIRFNELAGQGERVAGAFHLTC